MVRDLKPDDIYLNELQSVARCVVLNEQGHVTYFSFTWPKGQPTGIGRCIRGGFNKWAVHKVTQAELDAMPRPCGEFDRKVQWGINHATIAQIKAEYDARMADDRWDDDDDEEE